MQVIRLNSDSGDGVVISGEHTPQSHTPHRTMTFILRTHHSKAESTKEKMIQPKELKIKKETDDLLGYNKDEAVDEFDMSNGAEEEPDDTDPGFSTYLYTHTVTTRTGQFGGTEDNKGVYLGWKLEAVKGYMQNEQEAMHHWWKDINTNRSSGFTADYIDLI